MPQTLTPPLSYLITSGATKHTTTPACAEFVQVLALVQAAVRAGVTLIQLREKLLRPRVLFALTARAAAITRASATRLVVNDRADIAHTAGADGVHLSTQSLTAAPVRRAFSPDFLIGVSTHTLAEAQSARAEGADFVVFGPVFDTPAKRVYGAPLGLAQLHATAGALAPFPVIALGGITRANMPDALAAGARGIAAIRLFADAETIAATVHAMQSTRTEVLGNK